MRRTPAHFSGPRRALTLVECLVASLLLALGASAVLVAMGAGLQHQRYAQEQRIATDLARQLLEQVSARNYVDPDNPEYTVLAPSSAQALDGYTDTVDGTGQPAAGAGTYARALEVGSAADAGLGSMPGTGVAVVQVTTPSGETVLLKSILPAK
jgi:Tfp pilus assembly protein PilV